MNRQFDAHAAEKQQHCRTAHDEGIMLPNYCLQLVIHVERESNETPNPLPVNAQYHHHTAVR